MQVMAASDPSKRLYTSSQKKKTMNAFLCWDETQKCLDDLTPLLILLDCTKHFIFCWICLAAGSGFEIVKNHPKKRKTRASFFIKTLLDSNKIPVQITCFE